MRLKHTGLVLVVLFVSLLMAVEVGFADEVPVNYRLAAASDVISLYIDDATTYFLVSTTRPNRSGILSSRQPYR